MKPLLTALLCAGLLGGCVLPQPSSETGFYAELGGKSGIKNIVGTLIPIVLADPRIKESFTDIDMKHLAMRLEEQFCELSGGPCKYKGKDMVTIHDGLNITHAQFNALAEDLQMAMERVGIAPAAQNKLIAKLAPMQRDMVVPK